MVIGFAHQTARSRLKLQLTGWTIALPAGCHIISCRPLLLELTSSEPLTLDEEVRTRQIFSLDTFGQQADEYITRGVMFFYVFYLFYVFMFAYGPG